MEDALTFTYVPARSLDVDASTSSASLARRREPGRLTSPTIRSVAIVHLPALRMCADGSPEAPNLVCDWYGAEERVAHRNLGDVHLAFIEG